MKYLVLVVLLSSTCNTPRKLGTAVPAPIDQNNPVYTSLTVNGAPNVFSGSGCLTLSGGGQLCGDNLGGVELNGSELGGGGGGDSGVNAQGLVVATPLQPNGVSASNIIGINQAGSDAGLIFSLTAQMAISSPGWAYVFYDGPPDSGSPGFQPGGGGPILTLGADHSLFLSDGTGANDQNYITNSDEDAGINIIGGCLGPYCADLSLGDYGPRSAGAWALAVFNGGIPYAAAGTTVNGPPTAVLTVDGEWIVEGVDAGYVSVGGGAVFTGWSHGECVLSSGKCNAPVPACQGNWKCQATVQGSTQGALGCQALADAGSASASCTATDTGTVSLLCYN